MNERTGKAYDGQALHKAYRNDHSLQGGKDGKRERIVWQSEWESGVINGRRNHEREENMVAKCTEFCPLDEKRMRTKERLLHRSPTLSGVK